MRKRVIYSISLFFMLVQLVPYKVLAQAEEQVRTNITTLEKEIDSMATSISDKQNDLDVTKGKVEELQQSITISEDKIKNLTDMVVVRKKQAQERLIALQTTDMFRDILTIILRSESIADFIERFAILMDLQKASNDKIMQAVSTQKSLEQEKQNQENLLNELTTAQATLQNDMAILMEKREQLATVLAANRQQLDELARQQYEEQLRLSAMYNVGNSTSAISGQENTLATQNSQNTANNQGSATNQLSQASQTNQVAATPVETTKRQVEQVETTTQQTTQATTAQASQSGRELYVEATAYSYLEPGLTPYTANGTDLRINPRVIAVDPRVIPLGTRVLVPGYGVYIAADTGGAIKGNKIDVHMPDVNSALQFGRRKLTITILD